jgi:hypothetical protein
VIECLIAKYPTNVTHDLKLTIRNHFKSNSKPYDDSFIDESNNTFLMEVFKSQTLANLVKYSIATITRHVSYNGFVVKILFTLSTYVMKGT